MPRRKQAKRTTVKDLRSILRLTYEQGLSVRAISERLQISKTSVSTYLLRAREAGLTGRCRRIYESEAALQRALFRRVGRPPQDLSEPDWPRVAQELKRKGVTLTLLWQEYRAVHPDGYGYTWFCEKFGAYQRRANPTFRHRHAAGAVMQTDYAGQTVEVIDPQTGEVRQAQIFVAVLGCFVADLRYGELRSATAGLDRRPDPGPVVLRRGSQSDRLRQSEGRGRQGVVVRADAQPNLCGHGRALRHDDFADPQPQAARQGQGRRRGADRRALDFGPAAPSAVLQPGRSQCRDRRAARGSEQPTDAPYR